MSTPKGIKKSTTQWSMCEKCLATILSKDTEMHADFCPPNLKEIKHTFVTNSVLCGRLDVKLNEELKNLSSRDKDNLVFLSQHAMQLCSFSIGENVKIEVVASQGGEQSEISPFVSKVWPTNEKSLTSVLFTKSCTDLLDLNRFAYVIVKKLDVMDTTIAQQVNLILLNGPKSLNITPDLNKRISRCYLGHYLTKGNLVINMFYGNILKFKVENVNDIKTTEGTLELHIANLSLGDIKNCPKNRFYYITEDTKWKIWRDQELFNEDQEFQSQTEIIGLENEELEIKSIIDAGLKNEGRFNIANKALVLHGHSGSGKTTLAENIARKSGKYVVKLSSYDLYSNKKNGTTPEDLVKELFCEAIENAPSILIIDEVDLLCPAKNSRLTDSEKKIVSTMMSCFDDINKRKYKVFVLATTNKIDEIDLSFRRYGRLDKEIEIPTPTPKARKKILLHLLRTLNCNLTDTCLQEISMATHGFVGADLVSLCSQANLNCFKRKSEQIELEDFKIALRKVRPSAMKEVQIEVPNVKWTDIGGQDNLKLILRQAVEWPLKYPESFLRLGISPPKGVLMFGPPGCSKTMIAKALANESGLNFLSIKGPELFSKWVGDSEKAIRGLFRKAKQVAPSIIFFDEIDALGGERTSGSSANVQERVLAQLLTELDGITPLGDVTILAATNRPDKIDKALLRPGRLDRIVHVPLPDEYTRKEIFRIKLSKMPVTNNVTVDDLVQKTLGYSGAEVNAVCHEAAMIALEEDICIEKVEKRHFENALKLVTPRTSNDLLKLYDNYVNKKYNSEA